MSKEFSGATRWAFYGKSLEWEPIASVSKVDDETGTYVEVKLRKRKDFSKLNPDFIEAVLQQYYSAILLGNYHVKGLRSTE